MNQKNKSKVKVFWISSDLENLLRLLKICKINVVNSKCTQNLTENLKSLTESHSATSVASVTIQMEPNYLDPISSRSNNRTSSRFSLDSQQNGIRRLSSVGSSSGPISPQGTLGSPSPPSMLPPPPPISQPHPSSLYVNESCRLSPSKWSATIIKKPWKGNTKITTKCFFDQ